MSNRNFYRVLVLSVPFLVFSTVSMAQQSSGTSLMTKQSNAAGINVGLGVVTPSLDLKALHDDNLLDQPKGNELDTWGWAVSPGLAYELSDDVSKLTADWNLDAGYYDQSSTDDYVDNFLNAKYEYHPTDRFTGSISGAFKDTRDPRGTGRSESTGVIQATPDRWHDFEVEGNMAYGLPDATARVEGTVGYVTKRYDNNLSSTFTRNRDDVYGSGRFFYRLAPKTSLLLEGRAASYQYTLTAFGTPSLDSTVYKFFGGVTWEATAKTTGTAKYGYSRKEFRSPGNPNQSGSSWDLAVRWSPRTYSVFDFTTYRRFEESTGIGDAIVQSRAGVRWTHAWNSRLSHSIGYDFTNDNYKGDTNRDDNTNALDLRVDYRFRRWLKFGAQYLYADRDSNDPQYRYRRNVIMFTVGATL